MLTTELMQKIMAAEMSGKPLPELDDDGKRFLAGLRKDIEKAKKEGYVLDIPAEWPSLDEANTGPD